MPASEPLAHTSSGEQGVELYDYQVDPEERNFKSTVVTFEFPWFGRTPPDMQATGRQALWALLRALDPPPPDLR